MAGVVAMAAAVEDFDTIQTCKKLRKDDDPPPAPTKTITNYFLPLPKPVDKPFSPPRTNSIVDYFQKTPPAQEKTSAAHKCSPLQSNDLQSSTCEEIFPKLCKAQRQKQIRKAKEKPNKSHEEEQDMLTDDCILESPDVSITKEEGCVSLLGSDTAVLLSQINHEICLDEEPLKSKNTPDISADDRTAKEVSQNRKSKTLATQNETHENFSKNDVLSLENKCRIKKSAVRRNRNTNVSQIEMCNAAHEQSLHDASVEVNVDETSVLGCSTVTVSFEDFLQSQMQNEDEVTAESKTDACAAESSEAKSCMDASDVVATLSPRTLTVQAEVHPISPDHESVKGPQLKMASIFTRNKKEKQVKDGKKSSSDNLQVNTDILPDLKRKSNVVLREEDLELAVVESSSPPKCTREERKQFMNAFKQPSLDGSKGKPIKGQSRSKPGKDNASETEEPEKIPDESDPDPATLEPCTEQKKAKGAGKKRGRKPVKKRQTDQSEEVPVAPEQDKLPTWIETENKCDSIDGSNSQCVIELRRSTRDQRRRQGASVPERNPSPRKTRSGVKAGTSAVFQDDVAQASTPKSCRPKKKIYRAEMLFPLEKQGSPIRMRFTSVFPSSATKTGDSSAPLSVLESNSMKRRKRAKKLVQKAKALQNSKPTAAAEKPDVRRSARSKESSLINYCEDEDSVVFLEDGLSSPVPATQESGNKQKNLRSLNDVLGKNIPPIKAIKNSPASKFGPTLVERKPQRPSAVISILDDNSREGSENSQDDEQFQAKREFLKSGLPETLKKQIAKTAANREAYAQACTSFQSVVHVQQRPMDYSVWTLPWPENPFLNCLKECYNIPSASLVSLENHAENITVPTQRACREEVSGGQENFTEAVRERLLEEISTSNPSFPVQRFFTRFLKRAKEYLEAAVADKNEPECASKAAPPVGLTESIGGKRKRVDEGQRAGKLAKKQKSAHKEEETIVILDSPGSASGGTPEATDSLACNTGQRRRSLRNKQATEEEHKPSEDKKQCHPIIIIDSPPSEICAKDCVTEDIPWTEKYHPQHSSDVIGNTASVKKLHSWLKEWKLRADREERRKQQEKKQEDDSNDCWLGSDRGEGLEGSEDMLCNTLLITGPTGVGKTAAVYACAQELGFKVFEVNCSSQRSGRQILSQLKEATQSHQVGIQGVNAHKPTYFNSYSCSSLSTRSDSSPRKVNSPRRVVSSPRKPPQSPRGASRKGTLAPKSLASFFKMGGRPTGKDDANQDKKARTSCPKTSGKITRTERKSQETKTSSEEQSKKAATSLILFEEVDVIFDDDSGFLAAVKTFMTTTKRPVILTTSDPTFSAMFDGHFDEIHFKPPPLVDVATYLQLLCLLENMRTDTQDLSCLLHWNRCDIRQSLLHLQFWTRSGGGHQMPRPILQSGASECEIKMEPAKVEGVAVGGKLPLASVPLCHVGCTESLLGFLNSQQETGVEDLLKGEPSAVDRIRTLELLSEAERRGVNLLYSNLEVLLPLPIRLLPYPINRQRLSSNTEPQSGILARYGNIAEQEEHSDDTSPLKVSSTMRRKKQLDMNVKSALQSDSDSEDGFLSLPKPVFDTQPAQDEAARGLPASKSVRLRAKLSEAERKKSQSVSQCLSSLTEYLDHVSFLDSSLHYKPPQAEGVCRSQDFSGAGAEVKCGMTDDVRLECESHMSRFDSEEIRALLGSLSFYKCKARISEVWNKVQKLEEPVRMETVEELTLPVASHRQRFSLSDSKILELRVVDMRREVMNTVLTSRSFSTQGNRVAATLDYLPSLRTICRSERLKEQGKVKRRFMHYLDGIQLGLPKSTLQHLASDFP